MANDLDPALADFSPAQRRIILDPAPIKQVIAAAGSGKTRTVAGLIGFRLARGLEQPGGILALSFSRKAAHEIQQRLPAALRRQAEISTFHSFCYRRLRELIPERLHDARILSEEERRAFLFERMRESAAELGGIPYQSLIDDPPLFRRLFPTIALTVFRAFYSWKRENGVLEYEDLQQLFLSRLRKDADLRSRLRRRFGLVIVDEFQDTDPVQLEFLSVLKPDRLLAVGDDWQSIYAFRGATLAPFLDFRRHFPGARVFRLAENYRSLKGVVHLGSKVIRGSSRQLRKKVVAVRGSRRGFEPRCFALPRGQERDLSVLFSKYKEARLLVRTNYRRARWIAAGLDPERILTVHRAKGLEFPVVFLDLISGWSGVLRQARDRRRQADEEIRILYVAITRAENLIIVLHQPEYADHDIEKDYWERLIGPHCRPVDASGLGRALDRNRLFTTGSD